MAQGKRSKGEESRIRLLNAAACEFAHNGYHDTKIGTIVANAGLTQAAFYLYFPSKEAIFAELVTDFRTHLRTALEAFRLAPETQNIPERVHANMRLFFQFMADNPDLTRVGLFQAPDAEQVKRELAAVVADNLRFEQQEGYMRTTLPMEIVAECLVGIVERLAMRWLLTGEKEPVQLATQATDMILHGILAST